jgi:hypothetical protein
MNRPQFHAATPAGFDRNRWLAWIGIDGCFRRNQHSKPADRPRPHTEFATGEERPMPETVAPPFPVGPTSSFCAGPR